MTDVKIQIKRIKGYNCPSKFLLLINDEPAVFANSKHLISRLISYVQGYTKGEDISDKSILRILDKWRYTK